MKFVCYADWSELPASVTLLLSRVDSTSLFFSRAWFENLAAHALPDGSTVLLACAVDGGEARAVLPLMRGDDDDYSALKSFYTSLFTLLCDANVPDAALACLARGLRELPCSHLSLEPFDEQDESMRRLQVHLEQEGFDCHRSFRFFNWVNFLHGASFAEFMAKRPAILRNTIKRKRRRLERDHVAELRLYLSDNLDRALADYHTVYRASWKANEAYADFVSGLVRTAAEQGWLRLGVLYADDKPVAAQIWLVAHNKAGIFRLCYDEGWKAFSPGSVLTAFLAEHVIDIDKVTEIDFYTGNERYKQDWMTVQRQRWALTCKYTGKRPRQGGFPGTLWSRLGGAA